MRVVNIMISKTVGGVEQAFLDYNEALMLSGHEVLSIVHNKTKLKENLKKEGKINVEYINFERFNYLLVLSLYLKLKKFSADIVITHSKKAIPILRIVTKLLNIPLIGVSHNPKYKLVNKCDAIFSITQYQKEVFIGKGFASDKIFVISNCLSDIQPYRKREWHNPPVIGTMGRFDPMKGFETYLKALAILKQRNISFQAVLGGDVQAAYPTEKDKYLKIIQENNLTENVKLIGWVKNKEEFYNSIDLFVLSSTYEPFGIVLLEAMSQSVPVVTSNAEGPTEIFKNQLDTAYMFPKGDEQALTNKLLEALSEQKKSQEQALRAWNLCQKNYAIENVSKILDSAIKKVKGYKENGYI